MMDGFHEEWGDLEEDMPDLFTWIGSVQLTEQEAESIKKSILLNVTGYHDNWIERMSARIDQAIARSHRRINQTVAFRLQIQTDRINRQPMG